MSACSFSTHTQAECGAYSRELASSAIKNRRARTGETRGEILLDHNRQDDNVAVCMVITYYSRVVDGIGNNLVVVR